MMERKIKISKAEKNDSDVLTQISFEAKRHWQYPEEYYEIWKNELTITEEYLNCNLVYKAIKENEVIGFYSIVENKEDLYSGEVFVPKGFWLEHIFIKPEFHYNGFGRELIEHAIKISQNCNIVNLLVFVDPKAIGFYEKLGAKFLKDSKSSIKDRLIPLYEIEVK